MSSEISVAHVQQYSSNLYHLSQQKGSRLAMAVRNEMQKGKRKFFDRIGLVEAVLKTSRHQDTPQNDTPHTRRAVDMNDYIQADMIDDEDLIRMLIDPKSAYVEAFANGFGRKKDSVLIAAMRGNAYGGEAGATSIALPAAQKVLCATENAPGTPSLFNIDLLRKLDYMFGAANVDPQARRYIAYTAKQKQQLLGSTEVTSSDYNTVKALVSGQIDTFMGFKFIQTQLLPLEAATYNESTGAIDSGSGSISAANARRCLAWVEDGVILSVGKDIQAKVDPRPDKNYATQVWTCMTVGATRLEEEKVIEIVCDESATA
jgi:hypothetical protein